jgi:hypothetical protein
MPTPRFDRIVSTPYSHLFVLTDEEEWPADFTDQAIRDRAFVHSNGLALHTDDDLAVRFKLEVLAAAPASPPSAQHVVEGSVEVPTGDLFVISVPTGDVGTFLLSPGTYQFQLCVEGLEASRRCQGDGREVLTLILWPGAARKLQVVKMFPPAP